MILAKVTKFNKDSISLLGRKHSENTTFKRLLWKSMFSRVFIILMRIDKNSNEFNKKSITTGKKTLKTLVLKKFE